MEHQSPDGPGERLLVAIQCVVVGRVPTLPGALLLIVPIPVHPVHELAQGGGVHLDTVRRWIRNKELEAIDLGGRAGYRITESDLEKFINERRIRGDRD